MGGNWSLPCQYGLKTNYYFNSIIDGVNFGILAEQPTIDLYGGGSVTATDRLFFRGVSASSLTGSNKWNLPPGNGKASLVCEGSDNPALSMVFADLPGQSGVQITTPAEGMEYNITDARKAGPASLTGSDLGTTVIGGGSQHAKVRYNGTNWTCAGF